LTIKSITWIVFIFAVVGGLLFGFAGRLDWQRAWIFMATLFVCLCVNFLVILKTNPEVIRERMIWTRSQLDRGAKKWDVLVTSIHTIFIVATAVIAGFDERYSWARFVGSGWLYLGIMLFVIGDLFFIWAMSKNKYFSKQVRIQTERGHMVISSGPYRIVRHPGYLGWSAMWAGIPLILNSPWAFIPALLSIILTAIRTALEDSTLQKELPGYLEYVSRVRFKLIPGLW
jgi:protein-S-isoprenylcysteine O-methyltransferase Ste14